jgi:predicted nucleic acid-binding protein
LILADTSIWIQHFRTGDLMNRNLLRGEISIHPFIIGELACGNLPARRIALAELQFLRRSPMASNSEVLGLIERNQLMGRGIGFIDAHLLASALMATGTHLWTRDRRLFTVAGDLGIAFIEPA